MRDRAGRGVLGTLLRHELRMLLRDTRTILIAVVAPLVILPGYILILKAVESRERRALEEKTYAYAVEGSLAGWASELVAAALALDAADPDTTRAPATFQLRSPADPREALRRGELHLVVWGLSPAEWDSVRQAERSRAGAGRGGGAGAEAAVPLPAIRLLYRADSDFSRTARNRMTGRILEVRALQRDSVYRSAGFPVAVEAVLPLEAVSVATAAREAGAFLGMALTPLLVLLMLTGGSIVAVDALSGEKERGTLETLLTTAAGRQEIVRAKLLAIIAVGMAVAVINVANLLVYLVLGVLELPASVAVEIGPLELALLLALLLPVAVLVAAALLLLSGASKSYKEYQVYFFPLFLAFLAPTFAAVLPGIHLRSVVALIPLAGVAVGVREVLVGGVDLPFLALAFLSTGGLAFWLTRLAQETLSNEKLISGADLDAADLAGGAALFPRHVLRWFLGLWVVFFVVSLWFGEGLGLRGQLLVNLVGIFFGGSLLMVRHYRLDPVAAFALRLPRPGAWVAVVIGVPSALVLAMGVARFVNAYIFPVPEEVLEAFGEGMALPGLPVWQVVLLLAILPGVFEELAFRGVLLHGLLGRIRRRWLLALVVGGIFGAFHLSLFRLVPTAWLGFVLAWVVLLSGSIYPAILWHALNNALAILPARLGLLPEGAAGPGLWWTLPAALGLVLSMWILRESGEARGSMPHARPSDPSP